MGQVAGLGADAGGEGAGDELHRGPLAPGGLHHREDALRGLDHEVQRVIGVYLDRALHPEVFPGAVERERGERLLLARGVAQGQVDAVGARAVVVLDGGGGGVADGAALGGQGVGALGDDEHGAPVVPPGRVALAQAIDGDGVLGAVVADQRLGPGRLVLAVADRREALLGDAALDQGALVVGALDGGQVAGGDAALQGVVALAGDVYPEPDWPLALHRRYQRREIIAAVGHRIKDIMVILILGMMFGSGISSIVEILQYLFSINTVNGMTRCAVHHDLITCFG